MTKEAYNQLFESSYSSLCNYAYAIVQDYDEAEDIVQGVFVNFWNNENKDAIEAKVKQYLVRSVKFKCIDYQRKQIVKRKHEKETLHLTNHWEVEEDHAENTLLKDSLMLAITELPEKTRAVFMMSKLDGLSYKEIADELEISPKTVENQMGRAFRHLREKLANYKELLALFILLFIV